MWKNWEHLQCVARSLPDYRYDNSIELIANVYCSKTMCWKRICVHKKTFQSLGKNEYECFQCPSTFPVRKIPFEVQTNSNSLKFDYGFIFFEETQKSNRDFVGVVYCPTCPNQNPVHLSSNKYGLWKVQISNIHQLCLNFHYRICLNVFE